MISVSIWRKTLVANHACAAGLALFDAIAAQQPETDPRRLRRIRIPRWTALHWIMLVQAGFGEWCAARGIVPRANLYYSDLSHADLNGACLCGTDLYYSDLSHADLSHADLSGADLRGTNLSHANISGADISGAYLYGANLSGAYRGHDQPPIPGWRANASGYLERDT